MRLTSKWWAWRKEPRSVVGTGPDIPISNRSEKLLLAPSFVPPALDSHAPLWCFFRLPQELGGPRTRYLHKPLRSCTSPPPINRADIYFSIFLSFSVRRLGATCHPPFCPAAQRIKKSAGKIDQCMCGKRRRQGLLLLLWARGRYLSASTGNAATPKPTPVGEAPQPCQTWQSGIARLFTRLLIPTASTALLLCVLLLPGGGGYHDCYDYRRHDPHPHQAAGHAGSAGITSYPQQPCHMVATTQSQYTQGEHHKLVVA